jgi:hypothetical protein
VNKVQLSSGHHRKRPAERLLFILFLLSLPFTNPWVRGDGVGYYAFVRAPLIEHNLDFTHDYQAANHSFRIPRLDDRGQPKDDFRTSTGHLDNHFTVGPAMLWTPFLLLAHGGVLAARAFGASIAADGFSDPYRFAMAFATALYGFLSLLLTFRLARQYVADRWALLSTIAIWGATGLPVYMYFNPSWSHAHSAFTVALFLWYWHETRFQRSPTQWLLLALLAGLMLNVRSSFRMTLLRNPDQLFFLNLVSRSFLFWVRWFASFPHSSRATSSSAALLLPATSRFGTGSGLPPPFWAFCFLQTMAFFSGRPSWLSPSLVFSFSGAGNLASASPSSLRSWASISSLRVTRIGPASLPTAIDFSFR